MKKNILITGSTKGIGLETARQLAQHGHHVWVSGRNEKRLSSAVEGLAKQGISVKPLLMDVGDLASITAAANSWQQQNIQLHVLINNAAILLPNDHDLSRNENGTLEKTVNINCFGPERVIKAFLPSMDFPSMIINISSSGGSMSEPVGGWSPAYCVSKTMLNAMTRHLAHRLQEKGIAVNSVDPGWVKTDMGGSTAPRTVAQGAATQVWMANHDSFEHTGQFFHDKEQVNW